MAKESIKSNIWKLNLYQMLGAANLSMPIIVLYFMNNGLSLTQVASFATVMSILALLLEIPSGSFADKKGRKKSLIIASCFLLINYIFLFFGGNYISFLFAAGFLGMANAFWSGANSALLYDSLIQLKKEKEFKKIKGNQFALSVWSFAFASLIGGFLGKINLIFPIAITGILALFQLFVSFVLTEPKFHKKSFETTNHVFESIKFTFKHIEVRNLILYSVIIIGFLDGTFRLFQPYFMSVGIDIKYFGIIYMISLIGTGIVAKYSADIEQKIGKKLSLVLIAFIFVCGFLLLSFPIGVFIVIPFLILETLYGFVLPLIEDYTNKHIKSEKRATVLSIQNFAQKILIALLIPVVGFLMDIDIPLGFLFIGLFSSIVLIYPTYKLIKTY
jgi:MFS family permease